MVEVAAQESRRLPSARCRWLRDEAASLPHLDASHHRLAAFLQFEDLTDIAHLNACNNALRRLPAAVSALCTLRVVDLSLNSLTDLPDDAFRNMPHLSAVILGSNSLTRVPGAVWRAPALEVLDVSHNAIGAIEPAMLAQCQSAGRLRELNLSSNKLRCLPENIGSLAALQRLRLGANRLEALPESIGKLALLEVLELQTNQLTTLPGSLGQLHKLKELDCANNRIAALPAAVGSLEALKSLKLSCNQLSELPAEFSRLSSLQNLSLDMNRLARFPEDIAGLRALCVLSARNNNLTALPEGITQLLHLQTLCLPFNRLRDVPAPLAVLPALATLDLSFNELRVVPLDYRNTTLQSIMLTGNRRLFFPPLPVADLGVGAIRSYLRSFPEQPWTSRLPLLGGSEPREVIFTTLCCAKRLGIHLPAELWFMIFEHFLMCDFLPRRPPAVRA